MRRFSSQKFVTFFYVIILVVLSSMGVCAEDSLPDSIQYKISKIYRELIIDGNITSIEKNGSDDLIYSSLEYQILGLNTDKPILEKYMNGKLQPKGTRQLVRLKISQNGNIFLRQDEPDIPYNDGFVVLITIFPKQRIIIHSFQNESIESSIGISQFIACY